LRKGKRVFLATEQGGGSDAPFGECGGDESSTKALYHTIIDIGISIGIEHKIGT